MRSPKRQPGSVTGGATSSVTAVAVLSLGLLSSSLLLAAAAVQQAAHGAQAAHGVYPVPIPGAVWRQRP